MNRLKVQHSQIDECKINKLKLKQPLFFDSPDFEIVENKTNKKNALLLLLANRYSKSIWSHIPYDIVKIIAKEVAEPVCLMYLPIIVNGKKYRIKLEPVE
jgi:hypothetical protein